MASLEGGGGEEEVEENEVSVLLQYQLFVVVRLIIHYC
jgi:hypothetical protein